MEDEFESINSSLNTLNLSLERLGFNGAMLKDGPGAVESVGMAIKDTGSQIVEALDELTEAIRGLKG